MTNPIIFADLGDGGSDLTARTRVNVYARTLANAKTAGELDSITRTYVLARVSSTADGAEVVAPATAQLAVLVRVAGVLTGSYPPANVETAVLSHIRAAETANVTFTKVLARVQAILNPEGAVIPPPYVDDNAVLLSDTVALSSSLIALPGLLLRSALRVEAKLKTKAQVVAALKDTVELEDRFNLILMLMLKDAVTTSDTLSFDYTALIRLQDAMLLSGTVTTVAEATLLMVEAVAFHATMEAMQFIGLSDQVTLSDVIRDAFTAAMQLVDSVLMTDTLTGTGTIAMTLRDGVKLDGALLTSAQAVELLRDTVGLTVRFTLDDGHYVAWTMNADSKASSKYEQWPFNSYMRVGGRYYGVSDGGLYRLGGESDDGAAINARVRMGMSTLGSRTAKHVPSVYLGYSASGDMLLKAVVADSQTGQRQAHVYRLHANNSAGSVREARTKLGRGLCAVYWDFELVNDAGADFEIDIIEWMPLQTQRRLRGNAGGKK